MEVGWAGLRRGRDEDKVGRAGWGAALHGSGRSLGWVHPAPAQSCLTREGSSSQPPLCLGTWELKEMKISTYSFIR